VSDSSACIDRAAALPDVRRRLLQVGDAKNTNSAELDVSALNMAEPARQAPAEYD